jgi:hypothetical protein
VSDEPKLPSRVKVPGRFGKPWWTPNVDGTPHQDAPLSQRGKTFFYLLVGTIVVAGIVLIVVAR